MTFLEKLFFNFTIYIVFLCIGNNINAQSPRSESCRISYRSMSQNSLGLVCGRDSRLTQSQAFLPQLHRQQTSEYKIYSLALENSDSDATTISEAAVGLQPMIRPLIPSDFRPSKIILSIDGGGSRGIIPLYYIEQLLKDLNIDQLPVNIIAGTSVGSLIGTALLLGKTRELSKDFQNTVKKIFCKKLWSLWGLLGPRYRSEGRRQVIQDYLGEDGEQQIKSSSMDFLVPWASSKTFKSFLYNNHDNHFPLFDALMASSAAPTFFLPHVFTGNDTHSYEGVDGGIFANHPGIEAYFFAKNKYPHDHIVMISLGTGTYSKYSSCKKLKLFGWAKTFPELSMAVNTSAVNSKLTQIAKEPSNRFSYIRIDPTIERDAFLTDSVNPVYLDRLKTIARDSIASGGTLCSQYTFALDILRNELQLDRQ